MTDKSNQQEFDTPRKSPRAVAALDVEVEVEGQRRKVRLVSQDIGTGGIFLRTDQPVPVWKKVKLVLTLPDGGEFEVAGEVVRCVSPEQSRASKRPSGMAVAFDELFTRSKRKELVALVLDLCAKRPEKPAAPEKAAPVEKATPPEPPKKEAAQPAQADDESDDLLDEIDSLLDSVEDEIDDDSEDTLPELITPGFMKKAKAESAEEPKPPTRTEIQKPPPIKPRDPVKKLSSFLSEYGRSLKGDTYYDTLCVEKQAGPKEIEAAYKKLLDKLNPPEGPDSLPADLLRNLSVVLGKVRKAYAILSKPDRKRAYDFLIDNEDQ